MSNEELKSIIQKGLELLEMSVEESVSKKIVRLSLGFPHFTHLLAKFSATAAIQEGSDEVVDSHFEKAMENCISNIDWTIRSSFQKATITSKEVSKFEDVIGACASAETDEYETFATNDLITPYYRIAKERVSPQSLTYHLSKLCTDDRGMLLEKVGKSKNIRYRFRNPLMRAYIRLKLTQQGKLNPENLEFAPLQVDV